MKIHLQVYDNVNDTTRNKEKKFEKLPMLKFNNTLTEERKKKCAG